MFKALFSKNKKATLLAVDIGTETIKLLELDISGAKPRLVNLAHGPTPKNSIANNTVVNVEGVCAALRAMIDAQEMRASKAVVAVPGPAAFTKRVTLAHNNLTSLSESISFEAANYVPHKISAVKLDYQVLKPIGKASCEVLLVAVKNEILDSYVNAVAQAGVEPVIADVDSFAIENMFELNYQDECKDATIAVANIGARYTSVNIIHNGESVFTGDVGVGGRLYTDALSEKLEIDTESARQILKGSSRGNVDAELVSEVIQSVSEHLVSSLQQQIGFFWSASNTDRKITRVYLTGGGSQAKGLADLFASKSGTECHIVDCLRNVEWEGNFDEDLISEVKPFMGISVGLACRRLGDKQHAIS